VSILFLAGAVVVIMGLLFLAIRPTRQGQPERPHLEAGDESTRQHATYFSVIRQALSQEDLAFLARRGPGRLVRRAHKDRQRIALLYLADLHSDFERLLRLARVIAVLSPEVPASHEYERLRLTIRFVWRYQLVRAGLYVGLLLLPQLSGLSQLVSELAFRMECAMRDLGERAAVATELASTLNRSGLDAA